MSSKAEGTVPQGGVDDALAELAAYASDRSLPQAVALLAAMRQTLHSLPEPSGPALCEAIARPPRKARPPFAAPRVKRGERLGVLLPSGKTILGALEAAFPDPLPMSTLALFLWPDRNGKRSKSAVYQHVFRLRVTLQARGDKMTIKTVHRGDGSCAYVLAHRDPASGEKRGGPSAVP